MVRLIALALAALALMAGCSDDESSPTAGAAPTESPPVDNLPREAFVALALSDGGEPRPIVPETEIVVSFEEDGKIGWDSGCNRGSSDLEIVEDHLKVDDRFGSTLMGCSGPLGDQERWLIRFLTSDPEWQIDGRRLTLKSRPRDMELAPTA
jgi:heat shock protein HslJ